MMLVFTSFIAVGCVWRLVQADDIAELLPSPGSLKLTFNVSRDSFGKSSSTPPSREVIKQPGEEGGMRMGLKIERTRYIAKLLIGSNEEENQVLVDTGSSDLWVMSSDVDCFASIKKRETGKVFDIGLDTGNVLKDAEEDKARGNEKDGYFQYHYAFNTNEGELNKRDGSNTGNFVALQEANVWKRETLQFTGSSPTAYNYTNGCTLDGSFDTENSNTFMYNETGPFEIKYLDDSFAKGTWGHDTITIGNISVPNLSFGVANESSNGIGVLGLGLALWEQSNEQYENLPMKLKSEGIINKALYSFYLHGADSGCVLFGAVDHSKYEGTLETLPMRKTFDDDEYITRFQVMINQLTINNESLSLDILVGPDYVVLDPSSTFSYFRRSQIRDIVITLGGQFSSYVGAYVIDCKYKNSELTFDITFTNKTIRVPVSDLVVESTLNSTCYLGVFDVSVGSLYVLLGDNVLRNAYVVYDLEAHEIHLGQVYLTDDEDVEIVEHYVPTGGGQNVTSASSGSGGSSSSSKNNEATILNYASWMYSISWLLLTTMISL